MSPKRVTLPVDVYIRVSRVAGREGDSFISPEVQEDRCRALAAARGLTVGEVIRDYDKSGGKMQRPGLDEAIARIEAHVSGGIIVARLDRFARTVAGALQTLEQIDGLGGVVLTAEGDFDTSTATGELVLGIMLNLAQFELRRIRESWNEARQRAVDRGLHGGSHVPLGYLRSDSGPLEVDPVTAPIVLAVFRMRSNGTAWRDLARFLDGQGVGSGKWSAIGVKKLIANPVYLGEARSGDFVKADAHPPIVSNAEWQAAQREAPGHVARGPEGGALLAGGLLSCSTCGRRLTADTSRGKGRKGVQRFYRCMSPGCSKRVSITADPIESYLIELLSVAIGQRAFAEEPVPAPELHSLKLSLEQAEAERGRWIALDLESIDPDAFRTGLAQRTERMEVARKALNEAEAASATPGLPSPADFTEQWNAADVTQRRDWLRQTFETVAILPGRGKPEQRAVIHWQTRLQAAMHAARTRGEL